jgi:hypothetical protein
MLRVFSVAFWAFIGLTCPVFFVGAVLVWLVALIFRLPVIGWNRARVEVLPPLLPADFSDAYALRDAARAAISSALDEP